MVKKLVAILFALVFAVSCQSKSGSDMSGNVGGGGANATPGSEADLVHNVGDRVFFDLDSSSLSSESQATLTRQAAWLKNFSTHAVTVEGHCDERGTREYNLALGARRAESAKKFLVRSGIESSRVHTISYGKERPAEVGTGESVWSLNRRAVTVVNK